MAIWKKRFARSHGFTVPPSTSRPGDIESLKGGDRPKLANPDPHLAGEQHNLLDLMVTVKKNVVAPTVNSFALDPINACSNIVNGISELGTAGYNKMAGTNYHALQAGKLSEMELGQAKAGSAAFYSQQIFGTAGSFLTYAVAGKLAGRVLRATSEVAPELEVAGLNLGGTLRAVGQSEKVANLLGATAYGSARDTKEGESRLSNAASTLVGFSFFEVGNKYMLSSEANMAMKFGQRYTVGAVGGIAQTDVASLIQRNQVADGSQTFAAGLSGGFLNALLPVGKTIAGSEGTIEKPLTSSYAGDVPTPAKSSGLVSEEIKPVSLQGVDTGELPNIKEAPPTVAAFPPGTVEVFGERVNRYIDERQLLFDTLAHQKIESGLKEQMSAHREQLHGDLMFGLLDDKSEPVFIKSSHFDDVDHMREVLANRPENAITYEKYVTAKNEQLAVRAKIDKEFSERRLGIAQIMNEEGANLFPKGALPHFKVATQPVNSHASASYSDGTVYLPDRDIDGSGRFFQKFIGDNFTGKILHEMKHGEQDGLLVRKYIDQVVGDDTTARPLTDTELKRVLQLHLQSTDSTLTPDLAQQINMQRNGIRLSPADLERADNIETGKLENRRQSGPSRVLRERIQMLESELKLFDNGDNAIGSLLDYRDGLQRMFGGKIPDSVQQLLDESESQPKLDGHLNLELPFEERAATILQDAFRKELLDARVLSAEHYASYRRWAHEQESWAVGAEADNRLGYSETSTPAFFDNLLKAFKEEDNFEITADMVANPSNKDAFLHFENLYKNADPEATGAYEVVLDYIAGEHNSLSDPLVAQKLFEFTDDYAREMPTAVEQAVFAQVRAYNW